MGTPTYKGPGQPAADNGGFLGGLASWFGGSPPVYAGQGKNPSAGAGYKAAPAKNAIDPGVTVIDGEPLSPDSIALVIPRDLVERLSPQKLLEDPQQ